MLSSFFKSVRKPLNRNKPQPSYSEELKLIGSQFYKTTASFTKKLLGSGVYVVKAVPKGIFYTGEALIRDPLTVMKHTVAGLAIGASAGPAFAWLDLMPEYRILAKFLEDKPGCSWRYIPLDLPEERIAIICEGLGTSLVPRQNLLIGNNVPPIDYLGALKTGLLLLGIGGFASGIVTVHNQIHSPRVLK